MEKTIDIEKILTSKLGGKARLVPRCLINWLRKIAHEDQVNQFLYDHRDEVGTQWLTSTVEYLKMHITIEGEENLPSKDDGKLYTFVSNHPLGGQDGVALGSIIGPMVILIVVGVAGMAVLCFVSAKILKIPFLLAFATALTALYGFPPNAIITENTCNALAETPEEKEYLMSKMFPPMIVGGFTTVTITSVIIASVFAKMF